MLSSRHCRRQRFQKEPSVCSSSSEVLPPCSSNVSTHSQKVNCMMLPLSHAALPQLREQAKRSLNSMDRSGRDPLHRAAPFFPCCYAAGWGSGVCVSKTINQAAFRNHQVPPFATFCSLTIACCFGETKILQAALQAMPCRQQPSATEKNTLVLSASDIPG